MTVATNAVLLLNNFSIRRKENKNTPKTYGKTENLKVRVFGPRILKKTF